MAQYKRSILQKGYPRVQKSALKVLKDFFDDKSALEISNEASARYKELINKIPYIGGAKNKLTSNLIFSAQVLSFIEVLKGRNVENGTIGKVICGIGNECVQSFSPFLIKLARNLFFAKFRMSGLRKRAEKSRERKYKEDWVYSFAMNSQRDYTVNYHECGIYKLYKKLGYEDFVKYLCKLDFLICDRLGVRLERSKTIGDGDNICDFRFYKE